MKDLKQFIKTTIREFLNENVESSKTKYVENIVEEAKNIFMSKIKIFNKINFEWLNGNDFVGEYEYNSSLDGEPTIYLYKDYILSLPEDEMEFAVKTTIFHELGHAMTNIDNYYIFKPNENILQYEDEEEYVEDFAFNFEMFGKVPNEVLELSVLFRNKKWIGTDDNY
jgi:hypothetical protein